MTIGVYRELYCSISSVSIYYVPESGIRVKSYDDLNSLELLLFNFERLDILRDSIRHLSKTVIVV